MIRKMLYRYSREEGGYTVSLARPPEGVPYKVRWRLIAEEGRAITDGETTVTVIDVKSYAGWRDCDLPPDDTEETIVQGIQ